MRPGLWLSLAVLVAGPAFASPPSDASLEELFQVTNSSSLFAVVGKQMDAMIQNSVRQVKDGQAMTPERQEIVDRMVQRMSDLAKQTMSWETLKPIMTRVYQESFTQEDVDAMLKFYKSTAGQNMLQKMPLVMQNMMTEIQTVTRPMQDKMREIAQQAQDELKQAKQSKPNSTAPTS
jgi:hypothetical protein